MREGRFTYMEDKGFSLVIGIEDGGRGEERERGW